MLGGPVVALVACMSRRWLQFFVALVLVTIAWFSISPALGRDALPYWSVDGFKLRVVGTNLLVNNKSITDAAQAIFDARADVVFVSEISIPFVEAAKGVGFESRYPYRILDTYFGPRDAELEFGLGVYSKYPFADVVRYGEDRSPYVRLSLPDGLVLRAAPVHVKSPTRTDRVREWGEDLAGIGRLVEQTDEPLLLVGDFNSSRWQPAFGALLKRGLTDAHEATGKGLSRSWPTKFPIFRIDHALMSRQIVATSITDFDVPGSDHLSFVADLVIERPGAVRSSEPVAGPTLP